MRRAKILEQLKHQIHSKDLLKSPEVHYKLELIAELPIGVIIWGSDELILYVNATALEQLDHSEHSIRAGNRLSKLLQIPKDDFNEVVLEESVGAMAIGRAGENVPVQLYITFLNDTDSSIDNRLYCAFIKSIESNAVLPSPSPRRNPLASPGRMRMPLAVETISQASPPSPTNTFVAMERKVNAVGDIIIYMQDATTIGAVSDGCRRLLGVLDGRGTEVDALLKQPREQSLATYIHNFEELVDNDEVPDEMFTFRTVDKSPVHLKIASVVKLPHDGYVVRLCFPQKRRAVSFIKKNLSDEVANVLDKLPIAVALLTSRGAFKYLNPAAEHLFGGSLELLSGMDSSLTLAHPYQYEQRDYICPPISDNRSSLHVVSRNLFTRDLTAISIQVREVSVACDRVLLLYLCERITSRPVADALLSKAVTSTDEHPIEILNPKQSKLALKTSLPKLTAPSTGILVNRVVDVDNCSSASSSAEAVL